MRGTLRPLHAESQNKERTIMKRTGILLSLVALVALASNASAEGVKPKLGEKVSEFTMQDFRGANHSLSEFKDAKLVVVAFMGVE
jgi:hypothetical protein